MSNRSIPPQKKMTEDNGDDVTEFGDDSLIPLLQAPRHLRIKALTKVQELLSMLEREAKASIEAIAKARELAKNL